MRVEVVLTEVDIAQEFAEAIEARDLPEKFFFWSPRAAAEWAALASNRELYGGLSESWKELSSMAPALMKQFDGSIPVISFGAGDGVRDRILMGALKDAGRECRYFPVDASQAMLELACAGADDDDLEAVGIKADISSPVHLVYAADAAEAPRLMIMSGNTISAFDPLAEIRYLSQCMKPQDRLLIDGEIFDEQQSMARRDHPTTREFLWAMLSSLGIRRSDGEVGFNLKRDERHEGLYMISRYFRVDRDVPASVAGREISLERGERIGMNFQYVYAPDAFRWLLRDQGGLEIEREFRSPDGRFLTAFCRKS